MAKINSKWFYALLVLFMLGIMLFWSNVESFWYDEFFQIGLVGADESFGEMIHNYAQLWDYTPPLYAIIAWVWIRLVPLTSRWLLIPSECFAAAGVFIISILSEKLAGKRAGFLACIIGVTSSTLIYAGGYEFRAYALFFMMVTVCLYCFCNRILQNNRGNGKKRYLLYYGAALTFLAYSHYYGCLIILALFCIDAFLWAKKKVPLSTIVSYVFAGALFTPWMLAVLVNHQTSLTVFWTDTPTWKSIYELIGYLTSENVIIYILFLVAMVCTVVEYLRNKKRDNTTANMFCLSFIWIILIDISIMFFYATVINKQGGAFHERYFIGILPCIILVTAIFIDKVINRIGMKKRGFVILFICFSVCICMMNYKKLSDTVHHRREPYERTIRLLKNKEDIDNDTTAIIFTDDYYPVKGYAYLFHDRGKKVNTPLITQDDDLFVEKIRQYKKLYLLDGHMNLKPDKKKELNKYFVRIKYNKANWIGEYVRRDEDLQ